MIPIASLGLTCGYMLYLRSGTNLRAPEYLFVGLECGFSSKSALNANFKKHTGLTPTQFRQSRPAPVARE